MGFKQETLKQNCEFCGRSPKGSLLKVKDGEGFVYYVCVDCFEEFDDLTIYMDEEE